MILVVFNHVSWAAFDYLDGINLFFSSFRMPLFFFVSGFFAYKPIAVWNRLRMKDIITRKFKVQIVGASIFLSVFIVFICEAIPKPIDYLNPGGYWFTYVLFRIFIVYIGFVCVAKFWYSREKVLWTLLSSFAILCVCVHFCLPSILPTLPSILYQGVQYIINPLFFYYVPYFTLGLFARANTGIFEKTISNDTVKVFIIVSIVILWCLVFIGVFSPIHNSIAHGQHILSYPLGVLTMVLIVQFFFSKKFSFDRNTMFSKTIRFIGRRTLDIYFIHFFILPNIHFLRPYIIQSPVIVLTTGIILSLIVCGISLLIGEVIRTSPTLADWLLGVKKPSSMINIHNNRD